jgi:hypothetical protein
VDFVLLAEHERHERPDAVDDSLEVDAERVGTARLRVVVERSDRTRRRQLMVLALIGKIRKWIAGLRGGRAE